MFKPSNFRLFVLGCYFLVVPSQIHASRKMSSAGEGLHAAGGAGLHRPMAPGGLGIDDIVKAEHNQFIEQNEKHFATEPAGAEAVADPDTLFLTLTEYKENIANSVPKDRLLPFLLDEFKDLRKADEKAVSRADSIAAKLLLYFDHNVSSDEGKGEATKRRLGKLAQIKRMEDDILSDVPPLEIGSIAGLREDIDVLKKLKTSLKEEIRAKNEAAEKLLKWRSRDEKKEEKKDEKKGEVGRIAVLPSVQVEDLVEKFAKWVQASASEKERADKLEGVLVRAANQNRFLQVNPEQFVLIENARYDREFLSTALSYVELLWKFGLGIHASADDKMNAEQFGRVIASFLSHLDYKKHHFAYSRKLKHRHVDMLFALLSQSEASGQVVKIVPFSIAVFALLLPRPPEEGSEDLADAIESLMALKNLSQKNKIHFSLLPISPVEAVQFLQGKRAGSYVASLAVPSLARDESRRVKTRGFETLVTAVNALGIPSSFQSMVGTPEELKAAVINLYWPQRVLSGSSDESPAIVAPSATSAATVSAAVAPRPALLAVSERELTSSEHKEDEADPYVITDEKRKKMLKASEDFRMRRREQPWRLRWPRPEMFGVLELGEGKEKTKAIRTVPGGAENQIAAAVNNYFLAKVRSLRAAPPKKDNTGHKDFKDLTPLVFEDHAYSQLVADKKKYESFRLDPHYDTYEAQFWQSAACYVQMLWLFHFAPKGKGIGADLVSRVLGKQDFVNLLEAFLKHDDYARFEKTPDEKLLTIRDNGETEFCYGANLRRSHLAKLFDIFVKFRESTNPNQTAMDGNGAAILDAGGQTIPLMGLSSFARVVFLLVLPGRPVDGDLASTVDLVWTMLNDSPKRFVLLPIEMIKSALMGRHHTLNGGTPGTWFATLDSARLAGSPKTGDVRLGAGDQASVLAYGLAPLAVAAGRKLLHEEGPPQLQFVRFEETMGLNKRGLDDTALEDAVFERVNELEPGSYARRLDSLPVGDPGLRLLGDPVRSLEVEKKPASIVFAIDQSGNMGFRSPNNPYRSRFEETRRTILALQDTIAAKGLTVRASVFSYSSTGVDVHMSVRSTKQCPRCKTARGFTQGIRELDTYEQFKGRPQGDFTRRGFLAPSCIVCEKMRAPTYIEALSAGEPGMQIFEKDFEEIPAAVHISNVYRRNFGSREFREDFHSRIWPRYSGENINSAFGITYKDAYADYNLLVKKMAGWIRDDMEGPAVVVVFTASPISRGTSSSIYIPLNERIGDRVVYRQVRVFFVDLSHTRRLSDSKLTVLRPDREEIYRHIEPWVTGNIGCQFYFNGSSNFDAKIFQAGSWLDIPRNQIVRVDVPRHDREVKNIVWSYPSAANTLAWELSIDGKARYKQVSSEPVQAPSPSPLPSSLSSSAAFSASSSSSLSSSSFSSSSSRSAASSSPAVAKSASPEWACSACTYLNSGARTKCEMCEGPRSAIVPDIPSLPVVSAATGVDRAQPKAEVKVAQNPVDCAACGSSNPPTRTECSACQSREWTCDICCYINPFCRPQCGVCLTSFPSGSKTMLAGSGVLAAPAPAPQPALAAPKIKASPEATSDWPCVGCGAPNPETKTSCEKCHRHRDQGEFSHEECACGFTFVVGENFCSNCGARRPVPFGRVSATSGASSAGVAPSTASAAALAPMTPAAGLARALASAISKPQVVAQQLKVLFERRKIGHIKDSELLDELHALDLKYLPDEITRSVQDLGWRPEGEAGPIWSEYDGHQTALLGSGWLLAKIETALKLMREHGLLSP
jgi:hypothetical protein